MKKILITGGPVPAYLDDVKIITNKFKGGLMANLAEMFYDQPDLFPDVDITYLTYKGSKIPYLGGDKKINRVVYHDGIFDYKDKVLALSPEMDAVILGAAVANLIPRNRIEGKFPSHNYKPGDVIELYFTIAPRIIDEVKKVAPKTHLFGFKLLSGADYEELISAAYGVLLESRATAVFANDAMDLMQKYAVTKERAVHPITNGQVPQWIWEAIHEEYYQTEFKDLPNIYNAYSNITYVQKMIEIIKYYRKDFVEVENQILLGTVAVRENDGFLTTRRKKGLNLFSIDPIRDVVYVEKVDHKKRIVYTWDNKKATLNAPLLARIFEVREDVDYIVHHHHQRKDLPTKKYATPGTKEDSNRRVKQHPSFNIKKHGCILSFNREGNLIK
ncbi:MAG: phosphopantothenoylcysteine decarboxylase domain-containing protein [Candidatus Asgardarchaeia archaeon]